MWILSISCRFAPLREFFGVQPSHPLTNCGLCPLFAMARAAALCILAAAAWFKREAEGLLFQWFLRGQISFLLGSMHNLAL